MSAELRIVEVEPIVCLPWRLRHCWPGEVVGERCIFCQRDIAAPVATSKAPQACIYCALDRAMTVPADGPIGFAPGDSALGSESP